MVLREILTRFVDRALHPLVCVLILPTIFSVCCHFHEQFLYIYKHLVCLQYWML
jgi:hypothetical protein